MEEKGFINEGIKKSNIERKEKAIKNFKKLVFENGHKILSEYLNNKTKILIDFKCGHEPHLITPNMYNKGKGCPLCHNLNRGNIQYNKGKERFLKLLEENNIKVLSEYNGQNEKMLVSFNCKHEPQEIMPINLKESIRKKAIYCNECRNFKRINSLLQIGYKALNKKLQKNDEILISDYNGMYSLGTIQFNCKHSREMILNDYVHGNVGCLICKPVSKGENIIREWLDEKNIKHKHGRISQNNRWLYDVIIPTYNLIVEIHGIQHYEECNLHKIGNKTLKKIQENDINKRKFAENLGYNYMEVDYREHIPEKALDRFINQFEQIAK